MIALFSFCDIAFYLVPYYLSASWTSSNMFLMFLTVGIADSSSSCICLLLDLQRRDIRRQLTVWYAITCVGSVVIMHLSSSYKGASEVPLALGYLLLYVGICVSFNLVYLIVNELFPTVFLATAFGACNIVGRTVTILSPLVAQVPEPFPLMVLFVFSGICTFLPCGLVRLRHE